MLLSNDRQPSGSPRDFHRVIKQFPVARRPIPFHAQSRGRARVDRRLRIRLVTLVSVGRSRRESTCPAVRLASRYYYYYSSSQPPSYYCYNRLPARRRASSFRSSLSLTRSLVLSLPLAKFSGGSTVSHGRRRTSHLAGPPHPHPAPSAAAARGRDYTITTYNMIVSHARTRTHRTHGHSSYYAHTRTSSSSPPPRTCVSFSSN